MKRFVITIIVLAAIGCGGWAALKWFKPAEHEGEEEKVATEVAVRVAKVTRATLHRYVEGWGTVEPEPPHDGHTAASARVASPVAGVVVQACCAEGQRVEKGATMFELDARLADVQIAKARQALEFAQRNFERQKKLMQGEGTSVKAFQEIEQQLQAASNDLANAQTQRDLLRITAPLAGTVTRVGVNPGEAVELLTVMAEMIDLDRLVVSANIPSAELPYLKLGQPMELRVEQPGAEADGKPVCAATLCFIAPQVDPKTGSVLVRGTIPARDGLRPGQFVRVRIASEERRDRLAVPRESVVTAEDGHTVVAVVEGDKAVQKPVKVGLRDGGLVEVEGEGLKEGDAVVSEGAYALPKETRVRLIGQ
ncbi:MAG: efflux RND transporter periplasmic adaptor subunit [Verrucomicrobia bacterium]|nr:efflux RND transporter periplasmic adaptor subunit [Verrucomicrobiota bacterium]